MELIKTKKHTKKDFNEPEPIKTYDVRLCVKMIQPHEHMHLHDVCLYTEFLKKGVDWNDIPLIQKGIAWKGNVNYTYTSNSSLWHMANLNLIQIACGEKEYDTVKTLLTAPDINVNACAQGISPAFHLALLRENESIFNLLMQHDPQIIHACDENGCTALHITCWSHDAEKTQFLLKEGARTTMRNDNGETPVAVAYFIEPLTFDSFYSKKLKKLVLNRDKNHNTQLHLAISLKNIDCKKLDKYINFLLTQGLSLWSRNKKNKLPADLAYKKYIALYKKYINQDKLSETIYYNDLVQKEMILHSFLRFNASQTQYALFIHILQKYLKDNFGNTIKELQNHIAGIYYMLNKETLIAHKYKYNFQYYNNYLDDKHKIKKELLIKPEPKFLWSAL
jgi:ankyrin repeat protein